MIQLPDMKLRVVLLILLLWLLPALACNMPVAPTPDLETAARQTMTALAQAVPQEATPVVPGTPPPNAAHPELPGLPIVTVIAPTAPALTAGNNYQYATQPGDTLKALSLRFGVDMGQIAGAQKFQANDQLPAGLKLTIPNTLGPVASSDLLLPDAEVVYSPAAADFDITGFVQQAGGYLSTYSEKVDSEMLTGAQIIQRVALETSINPRLLLGVLEYRSHWVFGNPLPGSSPQYPIGFYAGQYAGLYKEITLVARQLTLGYYGWRSGSTVTLQFVNNARQRMAPGLNAGTAAVQYLFSKLYNPADWEAELYSPARFIGFYNVRFGDAWQRAAAVGPVLPDNLQQPTLELPFPTGETWTMTGGPHAAWGVGSAWGGIDFAPASVEPGCTVSHYWATAAAPGLVVRSGNGQVIIDLDGDGREETGWALLYLHVAEKDRVAVGTHVNTNDRIGHPSCEGGVATGTHVHIARKYNGEWIPADGPPPFVLSGWRVSSGARAYSGTLTKDGQVVTARIDNMRTSMITR